MKESRYLAVAVFPMIGQLNTVFITSLNNYGLQAPEERGWFKFLMSIKPKSPLKRPTKHTKSKQIIRATIALFHENAKKIDQ